MSQPKAFPEKGFEYKTTGTHTTGYYAVLVVSEASLDITATASDSVSGVTFPAGVNIYGDITSITVNSGAVILYKK